MDPQQDDFAPSSSAPPTRNEVLVPTIAVLAVAVAALTAALMVGNGDEQESQRLAAAPAAAQPSVVRAPPLNPTHSMGAGPACQSCGVVESVAQAPDKGFRMRIRMDDGSVRSIEQRGALAAGSRVIVEGAALRLMPGG